MSVLGKRRRGNNGNVIRAPRRAVEKVIQAGNLAGIDTTQSTVDLYTVTQPGTLAGLRWSIAAIGTQSGASSYGAWAIVLRRNGVAASQISITDGDAYKPEQHHLVGGIYATTQGGQPPIMEGMTKTMRKLQRGDIITLLGRGDHATNTTSLRAQVQFFLKT